MKIIAVASGKGGVGKTTLCANLGMALRNRGHEVLSVDMDPQNGLGLHFSLPINHINGMSRATLSSDDWNSAIWQSELGDLILPYGLINDDDRIIFEDKLSNEPGLLLKQLKLLNLPDDIFVILDTPPGASCYQQQALAVCHVVVLPLLADAASFSTAIKYISKIQKECSQRTDFTGHMVVVNQVDRSRQLNSDMTDLIRESTGSKYFSIIHQDQSVAEAAAYGQAVFAFDSECSGAHDIEYATEILKELIGNARVVQ
jgi:cellulose synthase operon protein YhjQ